MIFIFSITADLKSSVNFLLHSKVTQSHIHALAYVHLIYSDLEIILFNRPKFINYSFFFGLFAISWAAPMAYGGSQARGLIGAVATSLCQSHSNAGSEPHL